MERPDPVPACAVVRVAALRTAAPVNDRCALRTTTAYDSAGLKARPLRTATATADASEIAGDLRDALLRTTCCHRLHRGSSPLLRELSGDDTDAPGVEGWTTHEL